MKLETMQGSTDESLIDVCCVFLCTIEHIYMPRIWSFRVLMIDEHKCRGYHVCLYSGIHNEGSHKLNVYKFLDCEKLQKFRCKTVL